METTTASPRKTARLAYAKLAPTAYRAMVEFDRTVAELGLEPSLRELLKLRASILNGCAYCVDMHSKDASAAGESNERLFGVAAWREAPFYSDRERAALALCDALTRMDPLTDNHEHAYEEAARHFDEQELAALLFAIAAINSWNRLAVGGGSVAGRYRPSGTS